MMNAPGAALAIVKCTVRASPKTIESSFATLTIACDRSSPRVAKQMRRSDKDYVVFDTSPDTVPSFERSNIVARPFYSELGLAVKTF